MPATLRTRCLGVCAATVVLTILLLHGCASTPPHDVATPDVISQLSVQADAWDKAILRKDRAAIEQNMSEDFRQIDGAGNVEAKASFVDGLMSPDLQIDPYVVEDFDVRVYGDVVSSERSHPHDGQVPGDALYQPLSLHRRVCSSPGPVEGCQRPDIPHSQLT